MREVTMYETSEKILFRHKEDAKKREFDNTEKEVRNIIRTIIPDEYLDEYFKNVTNPNWEELRHYLGDRLLGLYSQELASLLSNPYKIEK